MAKTVDCRIGDIRTRMKTCAEQSNVEWVGDETLEKEG